MELPDQDVMRTAESRCLDCGARLNAIGTADPNTPAALEPGEFPLVVCIRCGAVMTLALDLTLRGMTDQEIVDLVRDEAAMAALARLTAAVVQFRLLKARLN